MDRCREIRDGLRYVEVFSNVTGSTKEGVAQSRRFRAGSFTIVHMQQVARTSTLRVLLFADDAIMPLKSWRYLFSLFCFVSFSSFWFSLNSRPFVQSFLDIHTPRQLHTVRYHLPVSHFFNFLCRLFFSRVFCTCFAFSFLYG